MDDTTTPPETTLPSTPCEECGIFHDPAIPSLKPILTPNTCRVCGCENDGKGMLSDYFQNLLDHNSKFKKLHDVYDVLKADFAEVKSMVTQLLQKLSQ